MNSSSLPPADSPPKLAEGTPSLGEAAPGRASLGRRLVRGAFWSTAGRIASMGTMLLGYAVLARAWDGALGNYAAYAMAAATVMLLGFPATLGAPKILTRVIREGVHTDQHTRLRGRLKNAAWLMAYGCVGTIILMFVGIRALQATGLIGNEEKWIALTTHSGLVAAWMCLASLGMAASQALMGFDDFRSAALVGARNGGVISNVGFLGVTLILWKTGRLTLASALWAQSILNLIALIVGVYCLRRALAQQCPLELETKAPAGTDHESGIRWFFNESWPNLVIQLTTLGIVPVELLLVGSMVNEEKIADYSAVQRLLEVLVAGQTLATLIVAPFVSELYARRELAKLEMVLRGAATLIAGPALFFLFLYIFLPELTLEHAFGPGFVGAAWALRIASVGAAVCCLAGPNSTAMIMVGKQRELLRASLAASAIYFVVAPVMIYLFGIVGAASAVAIVFGSYNLVVTYMVKKRVGIWTTATFSPTALRMVLHKLKRKPSYAERA